MYESNVNAAGSEVKSLISEAERMLNEASVSTGERADELKKQGLKMLSTGIAKAKDLEKLALTSAKELAASTDNMVHENPWRAIAISGVLGASLGLVLGVAIARK